MTVPLVDPPPGAPRTGPAARRPDGGLLANPRADRVRVLARLAEPAGRRRAGAFLVEGPQAVREALAGGWGAGVRELLITDAASERHPELAARALADGVATSACTEEVLRAVATTHTPQGVLAVCDLLPGRASALGATVAAAAAADFPLVAVLARVRDPGNAGTVLRTADAAGAGAVVLSVGSVDVHNPKCVRSTAGSLFHLPVVADVEVPAAVAAARAAGMAVLAADGGPGAVDLDDLVDEAAAGRGPLAHGVTWIFGNEARGLEPDERALADLVVRVPLHGRAESLNLAAAAAVCLHTTARAQRTAGRVVPGERGCGPSGHTGAVTSATGTGQDA